MSMVGACTKQGHHSQNVFSLCGFTYPNMVNKAKQSLEGGYKFDESTPTSKPVQKNNSGSESGVHRSNIQCSKQNKNIQIKGWYWQHMTNLNINMSIGRRAAYFSESKPLYTERVAKETPPKFRIFLIQTCHAQCAHAENVVLLLKMCS